MYKITLLLLLVTYIELLHRPTEKLVERRVNVKPRKLSNNNENSHLLNKKAKFHAGARM